MVLPVVGTLRYNNIDFGVYHNSEIRSVPAYDHSGRVVKWIEHTVTVQGWIGGSDTSDDLLESYRIALTKPAGEFHYFGKGFGVLSVNGPSQAQDACWGPKPKLLHFHPLGGSRGARYSWECVVCIPECGDARFEGISSLVFTVDLSIDRDGFTVRTISGEVEIAQTRKLPQVTKVLKSADEWREKIRPDVPKGFQREDHKYTLSQDRNRLTFNFIDKQIPVPLPDGVSTIDANQTAKPRRTKSGFPNFNQWDVTLTATITLPADTPRSDAWEKFLLLVKSRISNRNPIPASGKIPNGVIQGGYWFLMDLNIGEDIFGRSSNFQARFWVVGTSLSSILKDASFWAPIAGTSFASWQKSLDTSAWGVRGTAGLKYIPTEETLIDLCVPATKTNTSTLTGGVKDPLKKLPPPPPAEKKGDTPPADKSWLLYENNLRVITDDRKARHRRLPLDGQQLNAKLAGPDPTANVQLNARPDNAPGIPEKKAPKDEIVQTLSDPVYTVEMYGGAWRIDAPVPIPRLVKLNGVEVVQLWAATEQTVLAQVGGYKIHQSSWLIRYALVNAPKGQLPDLANPAIQTDGG